MIKAIANLEPKVAAGMLARAALSLGYVENTSAAEEDARLTAAVIEEARAGLGIARDDDSAEALERIAELLDRESDALIAAPDTKAALGRLAERGELPSDLYEIEITEGIIDFHGKYFALEKEIIETTIRAPSVEQHFGPSSKPHEPALVSLFLRSFRTKWPLKDFVMLVAAKRAGFSLAVHQAWRVYRSRVDTSGAHRPVDWWRSFADVYGVEIEVDGVKGHFFEYTSGVVPRNFHLPLKGVKGTQVITVSRFVQPDAVTGAEHSSMVVAIDATKYMATLKELRVRREEMRDEFVPAPRASG